MTTTICAPSTVVILMGSRQVKACYIIYIHIYTKHYRNNLKARR